MQAMPWVTPEARVAQAVDFACEMACSRSGAATLSQARVPPKLTQTVHETEVSARVT